MTTFLQIVEIIVLIFVAACAIWGDRLRHWFTPPRLKVRLRSPRSQLELIGNEKQKEKTRYWHLEVNNENTWNPATGVKVFITKIERKRNTDQGWDTYDIGPIPLKWQFSSGSFPCTA